MGNCLQCFKEPTATALDHASGCHKEEMPEAPLYPAPSHVPASAVPLESILSNGNHLPSLHHESSAPPAIHTVLRYPHANQRRAHAKSAPAMGLTESRPSDTKLNDLFDKYKDSHEDAILAEGIVDLCKDLQVSPDDFRILVLAWKLNAEQMCRFSRTEFVSGLRSIRADSVKAVQNRLPELVTEVEQDLDQFKDLYRFTFKFGLDSISGQRILPTDTAIVLWQLVFTVREPPILSRWLNFLQCHELIRGIPRDTWNMFLNFSEAVGDDLSCYDDNEAWPSVFDDFVEFENDQANQNISKEKECDGLLVIKQDD